MFDMRCEEEAAVLPHSRARQEQLQLINNQLREEDDKWQDVSSGQSRGPLGRDSADHRAGRVDFKALLGRAAPALQRETSSPGGRLKEGSVGTQREEELALVCMYQQVLWTRAWSQREREASD